MPRLLHKGADMIRIIIRLLRMEFHHRWFQWHCKGANLWLDVAIYNYYKDLNALYMALARATYEIRKMDKHRDTFLRIYNEEQIGSG